jgi:lipopolysaccharide cholinephosphotransferase
LCTLISFKILNKVILPFCNVIGRFFKHDYVRFYYGIPFESKRHIKNIFPLKKIVFEGVDFYAPANYSAYLSELYGDWKKIPPEEKIVTHNVNVIFFED